MNVKAAAQAIRDTVTMDEILDIYGYKTKHGFMCCPFHGEKAPSLKVYEGGRGWHCFGCERGGSVIDFVMMHENCDFRTAVNAIDQTMHLGLIDPHEDPFRARDQRRIQKIMDDFVKSVEDYCEVLIRRVEDGQKTRLDMVQVLEDRRDTDIRSIDADEWTDILAWKEDDQYDEYRKDLIGELMEEVAAWRRKARRAT